MDSYNSKQPTEAQGITCIRVFQMLSSLFQDIRWFRFDGETGMIYLLAGESGGIGIEIYPDGTWEFVE